MSSEDDVRKAEIEAGPAYWEGDQKLVDEMNELISKNPDQSLGEGRHAREIREWDEERKNPSFHRKPESAPPLRKTKDGKAEVFSWSREIPEDERIDVRPDLYEFDEDLSPLTREEDLVLVETEDDIKAHYKKWENWDMTDGDIEDLNSLLEVGSELKMEEGEMKNIYEFYVGSEFRSKTYTAEEGYKALLNYLKDVDFTHSVMERAERAVKERLTPKAKAALERRQLGNNPAFILALSTLVTDGWGSQLDDLTQPLPPPPEME